MDKVLTIIIPTYNMEKYLRYCLNSLIVPNMDKVEVLVINDGSKDGSSAIAHEYQDKYPLTFRVIDKDNGNYGSCINRGLKEAKGKYIKVLDADDSFDSESYQEFIDHLFKIDVDLILSDTTIVDESGMNTGYMKVNERPNVVFDFQKRPVFVQMHCVTYKTDNLRAICYYQTEGISYTDQEWIFWPMSTVRKAYYVPQTLYRYLMGRTGQTMDPQILTKAFPQELKILERMIFLWEDHHQEWVYSEHYMNRKIKNWYDGIFRKAIINGRDNPKKMFTEFDKEIRHKYPHFFRFSNKFCIGRKLCFPYVWYWRLFDTIKPFIFLFRLSSWHNCHALV